MKLFKGFNEDMTCRDFQYEEGKTYEMERQEEREYQRNVQLERGITHNKVGGKQ